MRNKRLNLLLVAFSLYSLFLHVVAEAEVIALAQHQILVLTKQILTLQELC